VPLQGIALRVKLRRGDGRIRNDLAAGFPGTS